MENNINFIAHITQKKWEEWKFFISKHKIMIFFMVMLVEQRENNVFV